jgi:hypothetical protein
VGLGGDLGGESPIVDDGAHDGSIAPAEPPIATAEDVVVDLLGALPADGGFQVIEPKLQEAATRAHANPAVQPPCPRASSRDREARRRAIADWR